MVKAVIFDFDGVIHDTFELAFTINRKMGDISTVKEYLNMFDGNLYKHKSITPESIDIFFELQKKRLRVLLSDKTLRKSSSNLQKNILYSSLLQTVKRRWGHT